MFVDTVDSIVSSMNTAVARLEKLAAVKAVKIDKTTDAIVTMNASRDSHIVEKLRAERVAEKLRKLLD